MLQIYPVVAMDYKSTQLPEVTVTNRKKEVLHLLAYVREISTLTTYSDTIILYREKTVDFMIPDKKVKNYKGWSTPRVLASKSYYNFLSSDGLDSVSDSYRQHFSWSDRVGITDNILIPKKLRTEVNESDTLYAKYGISMIWNRNDTDMTLKINILSNSENAIWVPDLASYIYNNHRNVEFTQFYLTLNYKGIDNTILTADNLNDMIFEIESIGRARSMFRTFREEQQYFVNTKAHLYIIDRENIPVSVARKWKKATNDNHEVGIYPPVEAGSDDELMARLKQRVNMIDHIKNHLNTEMDYKVGGMKFTEQRYTKGILGYLYKNFGFRF